MVSEDGERREESRLSRVLSINVSPVLDVLIPLILTPAFMSLL